MKRNTVTIPFVKPVPSQLDIAFTEQCDHRCDYCWVDKSNPHALTLAQAKQGVDRFLDLACAEQTITFTNTEPLRDPELYCATVRHIERQARMRAKKVRMVTTTNGVNLKGTVREFILLRCRRGDDFILNISIDGAKASHDAHRVRRPSGSRDAGSSFNAAWKNFRALDRAYPRVIFTVTASEAPDIRENVAFLLREGFRRIDIFAQMFALWSSAEVKELKAGLSTLIADINRGALCLPDLRLLNRLWGSSQCQKLILSADGNYYLFEWVLALPYASRTPYVVGNAQQGIDLRRRVVLLEGLFAQARQVTSHDCGRCEYERMCGSPLIFYIWCMHTGRPFKEYFKNFCKVAQCFIEASRALDPRFRNVLDQRRLAQGGFE